MKSHPLAKINKDNTFGYTYDANGNMTKDEYKNIEIHYNHLNLPDTIIAHGQGKIINVYLADGSLLKRKVIVFEDEGGKVVEVEKDSLDYQGEFLFQQDTLSKIITEEGYASPSKSNKKKLTYFYVVSDHLGHSRVVLDEKENVVQTTAYYPYGLPITDLSSETKYKYLYTGKEFIGEFGLNWYDHHARQYDAEIGRWSAIDPSLQAASPYMAMGNNPMMYVDTDGRTWGIFKPFVKAWDYAWGKANQFARWADQSGVPSAGVGYNTAQGTYHYMGNSGNVYHNQYGNNYEGKVDQAVFDARGDYFSQQTNNASYNQMVMSNIMPVASNGGGVQREFVGTTGFGLSLEIALPRFIVGRVTSYTGVGIDAGFFRDKNGFGLYATTKSTKKSGVALSAQVEAFMTLNYGSDPRTTNIDRTYIEGLGFETGLGIGPVGGSYGTNRNALNNRISPYQMISISWGAGLDAGFVHWNTNTHVTH